MTPAIDLNTAISTLPLVQEKPCYTELFERIQSIWNAVCAWICDLVSQLFSWETKKTPVAPSPANNEKSKSTPVTSSPPNRNLAKQCFDAFRQMTQFLEPVEIIQCEAVCKSWKDERLWQAQGANYNMTAPESGKFKERFKEIHAMAFGKKEWKEHLKADPGIAPHLPPQVYRTAHKLQETHILTLIPATINDQPLSFNTFAPLAEKAGMKLNIWKEIVEKYGNESVGKALWVWMGKEVKPGSRNKTHAQAEQDYPKQLGKALYYTISTVAHYARYKICLFPQTPQWTYVRTCDSGEDRHDAFHVLVGGSAPGVLHVDGSDYAFVTGGVASLVSAEVQAIGP